MKLTDLHEMTMAAGNMSEQLKRYFDICIQEQDTFDHVGDIENIKVLKRDEIYLLISNTTPVAFYQVLNHSPTAILQNAYVDGDFRGQNTTAKFLWFLKRNEGFKQIQMGDIQSEDMVAVIKKIAHRFNTTWRRGDEIEPYDPTTTDKFYDSMGKTGWVVVMENDGDFSDWPKYYDPNVLDNRCWYNMMLKE